MKLSIRLLLIALAFTLNSIPEASAQADFGGAKRQFKRKIRSEDLADRQAAVRRMRTCGDTRGVKEMLVQVHKSRKESKKLESKVRPLLKKAGKYRNTLDERINKFLKQNPNHTGGFPAGLIGSVLDKLEEEEAKLKPLEKALRLEQLTGSMLKTAIGDLITSLDQEAQLAATNEFLASFEKLKKPEQKELYLDILGYINNPQAVLGLVGIAATATKSESRVAALESLERLGDHRGGKAAAFALEDEQWQVRAAALEAAQRFANIDMIPTLIKRLKVEQGRLRGDIIETLSLLSGSDYGENTTLWEKWWKENKSILEEIVVHLKSDSLSEQAAGLQKMEVQGFLLAARRILEKKGLTLALVRAEERRRLIDSDPEGEGGDDFKPEEDEALMAVGKTIASRTKPIRDIAYDKLILDPFVRTWNPRKRHELITLMGMVGGKSAAQSLASMMRHRDPNQKERFESAQRLRLNQARAQVKYRYDPRERKIAARALARCATGSKREMNVLRGAFQFDKGIDVDIMLSAVAALERIDNKEAIRSLIDALGNLVSLSEESKSKTAGVAKAVGDALRKMTKESFGESHDDWVAWRDKSLDDFKTASEKLAQENPGAVANADEGTGTSFYGIKTYSKRIVFILDISGSMLEPSDYEGKTKIEVAKAELNSAISSLPKDARFNIMFYSTDFKVWQKKLVNADVRMKKAAKTYVIDTEAGGGTNIYEPLVKAFDMAGRGSKDPGYGDVALDTIFFLSDGQPTAGRITNPEDILGKVRELNKLSKIKIHTVGVGKGHAAQFMRLLAETSGGKYVAK